MMYFFNSTNKRDKIIHPISVSTNKGAKHALWLATISFRKNAMIGSPKRININSK